MNYKANKTITSTYYLNPETGYSEIRALWKEMLAEGKPGFAEQLIYKKLLGRDWTNGICPAKDKNKLNQMYWTYYYEKSKVHKFKSLLNASLDLAAFVQEITDYISGLEVSE